MPVEWPWLAVSKVTGTQGSENLRVYLLKQLWVELYELRVLFWKDSLMKSYQFYFACLASKGD